MTAVNEYMNYMMGVKVNDPECVGTKKNAPKHLESHLQRQCVKWFRMQYPKITMLLFAVPNGGYRNEREAKIMKDEGVVAGVSDLILLYPSCGYHGLCIEMKYGKGRQSEHQKEFEKTVMEAGYRYIVINKFEDFVDTVNTYINSR